MQKRALDLFCCAGGAAKGLQKAGLQVTGVDISPQPRYCGDVFLQEDALAFKFSWTGEFVGGSLDHFPECCDRCGLDWDRHFDFVWASPPCQHYSALNTMTNRRPHPDLVGAVRNKLKASGIPYAIENVFGAPLIFPTLLCGSFFGLESHGYQLRRHRYFETSFPILNGHHCDHHERTMGIYGQKVRDIALEKRHYAKDKETRGAPIGVVLPQEWGREAMGIDWMNMQELSEAIPPAYSEYIARRFLGT